MLEDLLGDTLQRMLEAEMDESLGYSRYDYKNKDTDNSRNGYSKKTVFLSDDALFKSIYLAMVDITKKWTGTAWNWGQTLEQLMIYFRDRIALSYLE